MPSLLEGGYLYIGQPPLYRLARGKQEQFFKDDNALNSYLFELANSSLTIECESTGQPIPSLQMVTTLRQLSQFSRIVEHLDQQGIWEIFKPQKLGSA